MQNMRAASPEFDKWEVRPSVYGLTDTFMKQTDQSGGILSSALKEKAMISIGNLLQTPVIDFTAGLTISATRSVTIADVVNTSRMFDFTFNTLSWGFTQVPSNHMNNEISLQEEFDRNYKQFLYLVADTIETGCNDALNSAKTQVFGKILQPYSNTGNILTTALANEKRIIGDIRPHMTANKFFGQLDVIGNPGFESLALRLRESGLYNAENKVIQFNDKMLHFSNAIADATGYEATFYAVNQGSVGLLFRIEREAILKTVSETSHRWGIDTLPVIGCPVSTYFYKSVGDQSAAHGAATADNTRAVKHHFGWSIDVCYVTAYNSAPTTNASPIMKLAVATT